MNLINLTTGMNQVPVTDYKSTTWSGGEINLRFSHSSSKMGEATIYTRLHSSRDIIELFLAASMFEKAHVVFPYLPYARQDRACHDGEPFSLKVFASLLNSQNFASVKVFDPHSTVAECLINNFVSVSNQPFIWNVITKLPLSRVCFVSPDAGAFKKVEKLSDGFKIPSLNCFKKRSLDGDITSIYIPEPHLDPYMIYLIVDDICDGGRTFIALANALKAAGAQHIQLAVSHGIFSQGLDCLTEAGIEHIWTTNSFLKHLPTRSLSYITIFDVMHFLKGDEIDE